MANFDNAFKKTMVFEGGYVNDPDDKGGETYKGVARKFWPKWSGWTIIDAYRHAGFPKNLESLPELQKFVSDFYYNNFWVKIAGDKLKNDSLAADLFDTAVNNGVVTAIKLMQKSVNLPETGIADYTFINKLNSLV